MSSSESKLDLWFSQRWPLKKTELFLDMQCSLLKVNEHFSGTYHLYYKSMQVQSICTSEKSVYFLKTKQHYITED
jgi:hypothetical protein